MLFDIEAFVLSYLHSVRWPFKKLYLRRRGDVQVGFLLCLKVIQEVSLSLRPWGGPWYSVEVGLCLLWSPSGLHSLMLRETNLSFVPWGGSLCDPCCPLDPLLLLRCCSSKTLFARLTSLSLDLSSCSYLISWRSQSMWLGAVSLS